MTNALPSGSRDDPDALAAEVASLRLPAPEREAAFLRLRPFIERQVRRVCVRFSGQTRQDLVDDALRVVWEALSRFQAGRPFEPWCRAVLKNHLIDSLRRSRQDRSGRRTRNPDTLADSVCQGALEAALERGEVLPRADVEKMADWPARDRVVLGCLAGIWRKLPADLWIRWVDEFRREFGFPEPGGFPPESFELNQDPHERVSLLATLLGQRLNTIRVWMHRGKERLGLLSYVRDRVPHLQGGEP